MIAPASFRTWGIALPAVIFAGCAHTKTLQDRVDGAAVHRANGSHQRALVELRTALAEVPAGDLETEQTVHFLVADVLIDLSQLDAAGAEARAGLAISAKSRRRNWFEAFEALRVGQTEDAVHALARLVAGGYRDVREFFGARWLGPVRAHPYYRVLVASIVLNAGQLSEGDARRIVAAGGIDLQPLSMLVSAPDAAPTACALAVIQVREALGQSAGGMTRVVAELVHPRVEGTGVDYETRTMTTEVTPGVAAGLGDWTGPGVRWGPRLLQLYGANGSVLRREEVVPTSVQSVVLNPQGLFAVYQYKGIDPLLVQNRVAVVFGCQKEVAVLPRAGLQQQRAPVLDIVAYVPFEADGIPIRRAAGEAVLSQ